MTKNIRKSKTFPNHNIDKEKTKIKNRLAPDESFGFCKIFFKKTKQSGFHLIFYTSKIHDIIYKALADDITVPINNLHPFVPVSILLAKHK